MNHAKMLGLLAVAAAALMASAGTASATLEDENGALQTGWTLHFRSGGATSLTGSISVTCQKWTIHLILGSNEKTSATGSVNSLTFEECGNHTVSVKNGGSLTINSKNQVFSTGAEVTVLLHSFLLGTVHCIYTTSSTDIGDLTEGTGATLDISSVSIPQTTTDGACGEHLTWEGSSTVTTPHTLNNN